MEKIAGLKIEDIYWNLRFGKSRKQLSVYQMRENLQYFIKSPIFFLSTGRCGTRWFSDLFLMKKELMVLHDPSPNLGVQNVLAYKINTSLNKTNFEYQSLQEMILASRETFLRYSYKSEKRFLETNNSITFFAPQLQKLFPDAKFVHLYRHPGEYVRSGVRRNYFTPGNKEDIKRIKPETDTIPWEGLSQIAKISWLWNETNQFIENFKKNNPQQCLSFNFNELTKENVKLLLEFIEITIPEHKIIRMLNTKVNEQKGGDFPKYKAWSEEQKDELRIMCNDLAQSYQYEL